VESTVKVIILSESVYERLDIIDELLENPLKIIDFKPFSRDEIYDKLQSFN